MKNNARALARAPSRERAFAVRFVSSDRLAGASTQRMRGWLLPLTQWGTAAAVATQLSPSSPGALLRKAIICRERFGRRDDGQVQSLDARTGISILARGNNNATLVRTRLTRSYLVIGACSVHTHAREGARRAFVALARAHRSCVRAPACTSLYSLLKKRRKENKLAARESFLLIDDLRAGETTRRI